MDTQGLRVRQARPEDVEELVALHTFAFPDPRGHEARVTNFTRNPLGGLDRLRVIEDRAAGRAIAGHAFLFDVEVFIAGRAVRTGAIATVGVDPARRSRGIASHLVHALEEEAKREGMALLMLHAYRHGFYARLGFEPVTPYQRIVFSPRSVSPRVDAPDAITVRAVRGTDRGALELLFDRAGTRGTGFFRRSRALWDLLLADERLLYVIAEEANGAARGAAAYRLRQTEPHARVDMQVEDFFSESDRATRALLAHLGTFRDQVAIVELSVPWGDPLALALTDPDVDRFGTKVLEHDVGNVCAGPMVKIIDLPALLASRGYTANGHATLAASEQSLRISASEGRVDISQGARDGADITFDRGASSVLAGSVAVTDAVRLGWARAKDDEALARATALLAAPPFFTHDTF